MVEKLYKVVWTGRSQQQLKEAYEYISQQSPQNALKVIDDLTIAVAKAGANPEYYNADKYKKDNDGSYRAFEKHHYRIAYRYNNNVVRVLRVRHTAKEPLVY